MIKIYSDFFSNGQSSQIFSFVTRSLFKIGWEDTDEPQHKAYPNIHSVYSREDIDKIDLLKPIIKKTKLTEKQYHKCIVNLTKPMDVNFIHEHPKQVVALYYANMSWNPEWGGETIFYKKDRKTVSLCNPYTPNSLVVFDGSVPHTIKSQNLLGPSYRFTISLFFNV